VAKSSRFRVQLRRRRERKTDYQARKALVVSGKPRLVARSTLKNTVVQLAVAKPHGDEVLASAHSRELQKKYGWKAPTGNVPEAYLTGLLCGLKAKANGVGEAILDIGLVAPTKGAKVFAALGGVLDAGVEVPHDEEKLVKERAKGAHIVKYVKSLGSPEAYAPKFSVYLARGLPPEKIPEHFAQVKNDILAAFGLAVKSEPKQAEKAEKSEKPEAKVTGAKPGAKAEKAAKTRKTAKIAKTAKKAETKKAAKIGDQKA
jgi:large subunit ribosomal protein L18